MPEKVVSEPLRAAAVSVWASLPGAISAVQLYVCMVVAARRLAVGRFSAKGE